jgi:DsbE subfamily thiol:disulfide oxidoreductase
MTPSKPRLITHALTLAATLSWAALASAAHTPAHAPKFALPGRDETVSLDSTRARITLVDFWASWCVPCRKSFPWMASLHERYGARGLRVVAINLDKDRESADQFLGELKPPFTIAFDGPDGKTAEAFHVKAMPSSFLVDSTGVIVYSHAGFDPKKTAPLETLIQQRERLFG